MSEDRRRTSRIVVATCLLVAAANLLAVAAVTSRVAPPPGQGAVAEPAASPSTAAIPAESAALPPREALRDDAERAALHAGLAEWIAATNARDLKRHMALYPPTVPVYYRDRNVSRDAVLADKRRVFGRARVVDVRASAPDITLDGYDVATMRFRKTYDIRGPQGNRRGETLQELRWVKTASGWKITSERDVQVLR